MKCEFCLYEDSCSLRDIASDITGCDGHSKEKTIEDIPIKQDNVYFNCTNCNIKATCKRNKDYSYTLRLRKEGEWLYRPMNMSSCKQVLLGYWNDKYKKEYADYEIS